MEAMMYQGMRRSSQLSMEVCIYKRATGAAEMAMNNILRYSKERLYLLTLARRSRELI
jgi:hypothetical protein